MGTGDFFFQGDALDDRVSAKVDQALLKMLESHEERTLPVIVQTEDGLTPRHETVVRSLGGTVKDDLYIISAFSADMPASAIPLLVLSPGIKRVYYDGQVQVKMI